MGGVGSGRKPDPVKKLIGFNQPKSTDADPAFFIPNYSGLKEGAKKTSSESFASDTDLTNLSGQVALLGSPEVFQTELDALSGAYYTHEDDSTIHFTSGAIWTELSSVSGATNTLNTDLTNLSGQHNTLSGAFESLSGATDSHINLANEHIDWTGATQDLITSGRISAGGATDGVDMGLVAGSATIRGIDSDVQAYNDLYIRAQGNPQMTISTNGNVLFSNGKVGIGTTSPSEKLEVVGTISGSHVISPDIANLSGSYYTHEADDTIHFTSGAIWTSINKNNTDLDNLSGAVDTHLGDSTDPHGTTLTQTHLSLGSGAITNDQATTGAAYIPNVIFATSSGGITASGYTQGSLLVVYS